MSLTKLECQQRIVIVKSMIYPFILMTVLGCEMFHVRKMKCLISCRLEPKTITDIFSILCWARDIKEYNQRLMVGSESGKLSGITFLLVDCCFIELYNFRSVWWSTTKRTQSLSYKKVTDSCHEISGKYAHWSLNNYHWLHSLVYISILQRVVSITKTCLIFVRRSSRY
jgi:hypothetical protein